VKRRRKQPAATTEPTSDQISQYMHALAEEHQAAWHAELTSPAPHWVYLIGLHLRLVELEHVEEAAQELL
jgi:hypothetical protein